MTESNKALTQKFYTSFSTARSELTSRLDAIKDGEPPSQDTLDAISADIAKLRKELVDATGYLPSYDQRQYEQFVKSSEQTLTGLRVASAPKPKFAFKRKQGAPPGKAAIVPESQDTVSTLSIAASSTTGKILSMRSNASLSWTSIPPTPSPSSDLLISDLDHCILDLTAPSSASEGDTRATGGTITALHIQNVTDSVLLFPPTIEGSALLHNLKRCIIVLGCHQFRMHTSSQVDVYLSIGSNPIIEHCSAVRFGAYPVCMSMTSKDLSESKYSAVQDFSHIRATPSPNWTLLPDDKRISDSDWPTAYGGAVNAVLESLLSAL